MGEEANQAKKKQGPITDGITVGRKRKREELAWGSSAVRQTNFLQDQKLGLIGCLARDDDVGGSDGASPKQRP